MRPANDLLAVPDRLTDDDHAAIEHLLQTAERWKDGEIDALEAEPILHQRSMFAMPLSAVAMLVTPWSDPRKADLDELLAHFIRLRGKVLTDFGCMDKTTLNDSDGVVAGAFPGKRPWPRDRRFPIRYDGTRKD